MLHENWAPSGAGLLILKLFWRQKARVVLRLKISGMILLIKVACFFKKENNIFNIKMEAEVLEFPLSHHYIVNDVDATKSSSSVVY